LAGFFAAAAGLVAVAAGLVAGFSAVAAGALDEPLSQAAASASVAKVLVMVMVMVWFLKVARLIEVAGWWAGHPVVETR
jgi:hypothetical protein